MGDDGPITPSKNDVLFAIIACLAAERTHNRSGELQIRIESIEEALQTCVCDYAVVQDPVTREQALVFRWKYPAPLIVGPTGLRLV